jgi:serine/threonine protein kinase
MDRIANAAPVAAASFGSDSGPNTHVRSIAGLRPEAPDEAARDSGVRMKLLPPGTCIDGKYILCDVLGTGGSAVVYAAEQLGLKRLVAFKLYPVGPDMAPKLVQRFQREAELLARVHHENVVAVFDSGSMPDGSPYLVVQCLSGESLAARLSGGPLPLAEVVDLTRQALHALVALGDAGITHRDIKPDNMMLDRRQDGSTLLKLVDFGVATERRGEIPCVPKELVGTPNYMAPEQVRGEEADARSDLYALGATVYELLTGRTPHTGETLHEIAAATLFNPITPIRALRPECPEGFAQIITRALAREPDQRFASARDMLSALDRWSGYVPAPAPAQFPSIQKPAAARLVLEDTFRIPTYQPVPKRKRRVARSLAWTFGLAALLGFALLRPLPWQIDALEGPRQVAAHWVERGQASVLTFSPKAGAVASAMLMQTARLASTVLVQLRGVSGQARDAAEHVLEASRALLPSQSEVTQSR